MPITLNGDTGITTPGLINTGSTTLINLTTTGNTILGDQSTDTLNVANGNLVLNSSGNAGLGVTPAAWLTYTTLQIKDSALSAINNNQVVLSQNGLYTTGSAWQYINTNFATLYQQNAGAHNWQIAPSGTAGNPITFTTAMTLNASGNLGLGTTPSAWGGPFDVIQMGTYGQYIGGQTNTADIKVGANQYYNGTNYVYTVSGIGAAQYNISGSTGYQWNIAGSGTAGGTITFSQIMTLETSGNLGVGVTTPQGRIHSSNGSNSDAGLFTGLVIGGTDTNARSASFIKNTSSPYDFTIRSQNFTSGTTGSLIFQNGSTEQVRIDASGNMGIGNSAPPMRLGLSVAGAVISGTATIGSNMQGIQVYNTNSATTNNAVGIWFPTGPHQAGIASFRGNAAAGWDTTLAFYTHGAATNQLNDCFERMRIDGEGNLLVGVTTPAQTISTNNALTLKAPGQAAVWGVGPTSSFGTFYISNVGTGVGLSQGSTSWGTVSDERLKDIIEPITNAAGKVSTLRAVIGKYKTDEAGTRRSFLIAQDVQSVLPEAIDVGEDEAQTLSVKYTETIPLLVAAIKELKAELDSVKSELATIKGAA
jgi:hypothetical protein